MRVVHLSASLARGGAEALLVMLVEQLHAQGVEQVVIAFHDGPHHARLNACGVPVFLVPHALYNPFKWWTLYRLFRQYKPDCIHTTLWSANQLGRLLGRLLHIPVISAYHNLVQQDGRVRACVDQLTIRLASCSVAVSDDVRDSLVKRHAANERLPIAVVPNGIDVDAVKKAGGDSEKLRAQCAIPAGRIVIGAVGRFVPVKRFDLLIRGVAQLVNEGLPVHLVLLGEGPEEKALRLLSHELGLADAITFVTGAWSVPYYCLFDYVVLPSIGEGFGLVLLEAFCFGLPCIVMHEGCVHPVVRHMQDGLIVPVHDFDALCCAMKVLSTDHILRRALGQQAERGVRDRFGVRKMAACYFDIFQREIIRSGRLDR